MEIFVNIVISLELILVILIGIMISASVIKGGNKNADSPKRDYLRDLEYSEKILSIIRETTIQVCVLEFTAFIDSKEIDKINRSHIQKLVSDIANEVNNAIDQSVIDYNALIYKKEFIESYIIDVAINTIKDLLSKAVNKI